MFFQKHKYRLLGKVIQLEGDQTVKFYDKVSIKYWSRGIFKI